MFAGTSSRARYLPRHDGLLRVASITERKAYCPLSAVYSNKDLYRTSSRLLSMSANNQVALTAFGNQITLPSNTSLAAEFISYTRTTRADGCIEETILTNPDKVQCQICNWSFRDKAKLEEHQEQFSLPCKLCGKEWTWCKVGLDGYRNMPYCVHTCLQCGVCFETSKELHDHGLWVWHLRCPFPRCTHEKAFKSSSYNAVYWHVYELHAHGRHVQNYA